MRIAPALWLAATIGLVSALTQAQTTRHVPSQYKTIQAAIDAARTGDTVLVAPGLYRENLILKGKQLTLKSVAGARFTTIDGSAAGRVIEVTGGSAIDGFTIRNGRVACQRLPWPFPGGYWTFGGGILADGPVRILNNVITGNGVGSRDCFNTGGGVATVSTILTSSSPVLVNNVFSRNWAASSQWGSQGGGFWGAATLIHNSFYGNSAGSGASVEMTDSTATMINCAFFGGYQGNVSGARTFFCYFGDPRWMDAANGDFHLRWDSPCRDMGGRTTGLPLADFEGDPRISGTTPDIGADEFHPRVYATGRATPGGVVDVKIIGPPGTSTHWAYSLHPALRYPPIRIPGTGSFFLHSPYQVLPSGKTSSLGVVMVPIPLAVWLTTPIDIPIQALVGTQLTHPHIVRIR